MHLLKNNIVYVYCSLLNIFFQPDFSSFHHKFPRKNDAECTWYLVFGLGHSRTESSHYLTVKTPFQGSFYLIGRENVEAKSVNYNGN